MEKKTRVLCLHGQGTSSEILRIQLAPYLFRLQRELGLEFHFTNGRLRCDPHPSLVGIYNGETYQNYSWNDDHGLPTEENKVAVKEAFSELGKVLERDGPFDGVLGFSQGASCTCGFLLNNERIKAGTQTDFFRFVILFSTSGIPEWETEDQETCKIQVPSLHVCGEADTEWFQDSKAVVDRCEDGSAELIVHRGDHSIPRDRPTVDKVVEGIRRLLERSREVNEP
ncbi:hypothetical protein SAPIO_CDS1983 [Scedosporium apiospermum]|uniref:Serine hydrolase domain-containing protein n=1 Tax=Pseudallescheria apiosperma TaxID=563466 RepID=A0A084GE64_PSEDA|nr:uncharacterized protein SAPIO_CDS1983 [Scedosporium apiospermum]KEZ45626.1 hypothetical protein SAPIO_CDS1983 [Scedosporium apiospermum]